MTCKQICKNYAATKIGKCNGWYSLGYKRCNNCEIFLDWDGVWCPCCNKKLRLGPRQSRDRSKRMIDLDKIRM